MGSVAQPSVVSPNRSPPPAHSDAVKFPITERSLGIPIPTKPAPPPPTSANTSHGLPHQHSRPPFLPFRRISLPSSPSVIPDRHSIASIGSFEVYAEDGPSSSQVVHWRDSRTSGHFAESAGNVGARRRSRARKDSSVKPNDRTPISQQELKMLSKRQKVIEEFYETEKAYVDGLELVYSHFLTPIISSLDDAEPLLNRSILTSIFSNFIDIWNLHRSFFTALSSLLLVPPTSPSGSSQSSNYPSHQSSSPSIRPSSDLPQRPQLQDPAPSLSPLLLSHFPYLSLYTPFITSFPSTISSLTQLTSAPSPSRPNSQYNPRFADFLKEKEGDPRCGRLKLRDWLLTIVQRCPRYLMLIRDLIACTPNRGDSKGETDEGKGEAEGLENVLKLVTKITESLNTSLQTHSQTLSLISLQKSCSNLPPSFHLISPGRNLVKRGELLQVESKERAGEERREVLLFSDCLVWFARNGGVGGVIDKVGLGDWDWDWDWGWSSSSGSGSSASGIGSSASAPTSTMHTPLSSKLVSGTPNTKSSNSSTPTTPLKSSLNRSRSRSDAQLASAAAARFSISSPSSPLSNTPTGPLSSPSTTSTPPLRPSKRRSMYGFGTPSTTPSPSSPLSQSHINPHSHAHSRLNAKMKTPDPPKLRRSIVGMPTSGSSSTTTGSSVGSGSSSSNSTNSEDKDKWIFKGKIDLINLDVVVGGSSALEDEDRAVRRFEVMSPEGSFVLYADSQAARDDWTSLIRSAKSQVMSSINMSNPYSTLSSSSSKQHMRRALVALPYEWGDERLAGSLRGRRVKPEREEDRKGKKYENGHGETKDYIPSKEELKKPARRRRKIDHYVPAIWVPDRKTNSCMRCGKLFGWRRRRHHCRLCGRCVCGGCSGRTFFITDAHAEDEAELAASSKPARACDACYDAVFPVVDSSEGEESGIPIDNVPFNAGNYGGHSDVNGNVELPSGKDDTYSPAKSVGTIGSLMDLNMSLSLPSWMSVPSFSSSQVGGGGMGKRGVEGSLALMAIDIDSEDANGKEGRNVTASRRVSRVGGDGRQGAWDKLKDDLERGLDISDDAEFGPRDLEREKRTRIRLSKCSSSSSLSHTKMRSYQVILDGFKARDDTGESRVGDGDEDHHYSGALGDNLVLRSRNLGPGGKNNGNGSADSLSGGSGWETDDADRPDGESDINSHSNDQYATPPHKPHPAGYPSAFVYNVSPSTSRYSLSSACSPMSATSSSPVSPRRVVHNFQRPQRREDTARRSKRFSLPAIGVHAASVTAHTTGSGSGPGPVADSPGVVGVTPVIESSASVNPMRLSSPGDSLNGLMTPTKVGGISKGVSLVLMGRSSRYDLTSSGVIHPGSENSNFYPLGEGNDDDDVGFLPDGETDNSGGYGMYASPSDMGLGKGLAAAKLSELLERSRSQGK